MSLDRQALYYRVMSGAGSLAYLSLIYLTWQFFDGGLDVRLSAGCIAVSGLWLVLTRLEMGHLLTTYFDILSRLKVVVPLAIGVSLSCVAILATELVLPRAIALGLLLSWVYIYILYRENRMRYIVQGHGPVPVGTWISPPADALNAGDLILTSGRVADNLRESVGHAEMVVRMPDGAMKAFSSYMARGTVLNPLEETTRNTREQGHYIVMRLNQALSAENSDRAAAIATEMLEENRRWASAVNSRRRHLIERLPLPESWKERLIRLFTATGYDWLGLFMGRLAPHHWTCIGACLELYHRLGIKTRPYGTGLLGFGTSILDPIMPVRFLSDPAFRLLKEEDKKAFENRDGVAQKPEATVEPSV